MDRPEGMAGTGDLMEKSVIIDRFPSKKNQVFHIRGEHYDWVKKVFADPLGFQTEKMTGDLLADTSLTVPGRLFLDEDRLTIGYEYINGYPVVNIIEKADSKKATEVMEKICSWLVEFYDICRKKTGQQYIWGDIHLRNLLYEEKTGMVYGVDFEECRPGRMETDAARIYVFVLHYDPAFTERKKQLARFLRETLSASLRLDEEFLEQEILRETEELLARRSHGTKEKRI